MQALGDVDELNSAVGMAREFIAERNAKLEAQVPHVGGKPLS